MSTYLIIYDIFNKKRLRKIREIVYSYKIEGQKSAIESPLEKKDIKRLVAELNYFSADEDKINIIRVYSNPICLAKAKSLEFESDRFIFL